MSTLTTDRFAEFFVALHGHPPFPWQQRLAREVCSGKWPECIALPTASGKTACIDIAVFALACQADWAPGKRAAPRRIFFVVDRRVIVDEAYERADRLAQELAQAADGILKDVADALRRVAGSPPDAIPLDVRQLRGGIYRDDSWVRSPLQPTVVASTVDQVGSRLLFRGYGVSDSAKPIHAALVGNDSLIVLDEAHCAQPFRETLHSVARYRGAAWTEAPLNLPFHFVEMSATPRDGTAAFRLDDADGENPVLRARRLAGKPARLAVAEKAKGAKTIPELAKCLAEKAEEIAADEAAPKSVAIIVNRVRTARLLYESLKKKHQATTHLMIGRMRPMDRDALTKKLQRLFASGANQAALEEPHFVVATQCLEVGADFDFDSMVCECASLDALRQRFGRLNRMGRPIPAPAAIVVSAQDEAAKVPDPIYGEALAKTWAWLKCQSVDGVVDFGIAALDRLWQDACERDSGLVAELQGPAPHAPVMLPAHVDCWCQTSPMPVPDPDVSLFLHGPDQGQPEVQLCWRADLDGALAEDERLTAWTQAVSLCPPVSAECLSVPLWLIRQWLDESNGNDDAYSDVLGGTPPPPAESATARPGRTALVWRGPTGSEIVREVADIRPGDTLVLPVEAGGWNRFGHLPDAPPDPDGAGAEDCPEAILLDCGSQAYAEYHGKAILRLHPKLWPAHAALAELLAWAKEPEDNRTKNEIRALLNQTAEILERDGEKALVPILRALANRKNSLQIDRYHDGIGAVLSTQRRTSGRRELQADDGDDHLSRTDREISVPLAMHLAGATRWVFRFADGLGSLSSAAALAAQCHDLGKADPRFQAYLRQSSLPDTQLWAKHPNAPVSYDEHRKACLRSGRPEGWRHELLSAALLQSRLRTDIPRRDLVLHLVAAHHGHCRPFAPVVGDPSPVEVRILPDECFPGGSIPGQFAASSATGFERLDSGVAERFWKLTRHYGWWGLPYLEACVRLADWNQSADEAQGSQLPGGSTLGLAAVLDETVPPPPRQAELLLPGIDGANPLGFLAALGTLRTLDGAWPERNVRLSWRQHAGAWRPVLHLPHLVSSSDLAHVLHACLCADPGSNLHLNLGLNLTVPPERFAQHAELVVQCGQRRCADYVASFGSEFLHHETLDRIDYTELCMVSGSGHQHYLGTMAQLAKVVTPSHIERTLFSPWDYSDERLSLRWDPADAREHAYQWKEPGNETTTTMWGANLLAAEGISLFLCCPTKAGKGTVGVEGRGTSATLTWPIWDSQISFEVTRSLLAQSGNVSSSEATRAMGIQVMYRSRKIKLGEGANFKWSLSPAAAV